MSQRKLNHLSDRRHLFPASTNIIVPHIVQLFLIFTVDRLSLRVKHSIRCHNSELFGLCRNDLELDGLEIAANQEKVALLDGPVCVFEVGDEVGFGEITLDALNSIRKGQDVDFGQIGDISSSPDLHHISEPDPEILPDGLIHPDLALFQLVIDEGDH